MSYLCPFSEYPWTLGLCLGGTALLFLLDSIFRTEGRHSENVFLSPWPELSPILLSNDSASGNCSCSVPFCQMAAQPRSLCPLSLGYYETQLGDTQDFLTVTAKVLALCCAVSITHSPMSQVQMSLVSKGILSLHTFLGFLFYLGTEVSDGWGQCRLRRVD